jgi:hypothetical protein
MLDDSYQSWRSAGVPFGADRDPTSFPDQLAISEVYENSYRGSASLLKHNSELGSGSFAVQQRHHAVWLYLRFTLSYRDVKKLLAERGLGVSYETVRQSVLKFGLAFARNLRPSLS